MPLLKVACSCGNTEVLSRLPVAWGAMVTCDECGQPTRVLVSMASLGNLETGNGFHIKQVDRTFKNARELDRWAEGQGLQVNNTSDSTWKKKLDASHEAADAAAQRRGYRDARAAKDATPEDQKERVMATREQQQKTYHDAHGAAGRLDLDKTFGPKE